VIKENAIQQIIISATRKVLADVQQRSTAAINALDHHDFLVALGALAGLEEQIRFVTVRLMVLREVKQIENQKPDERRKHSGSKKSMG
jgi:hypothetical protein